MRILIKLIHTPQTASFLEQEFNSDLEAHQYMQDWNEQSVKDGMNPAIYELTYWNSTSDFN